MNSEPKRSLTSDVEMPTITLPDSSSSYPLSPPLTEEFSMLSNGSDRNSDVTSPEVIRKIPRPQYPIRVYTGEPSPFSPEAQRAIMRWSHERGHFFPDPNWLKEPSIDHIKDIVWPYLQQLGADYTSIWIEFLAEGGFNRVYTIHTMNKVTSATTDYVFRVALPVDPYFKTESDIATTEIVRHFTSIPVPLIYAFDSSTQNKLGLEWMLMEKIIGKNLGETWKGLDYDAKLGLTKTIASWTAQLSAITADKIGNLYMRYTKTELEFYVGRSVTALLSQEARLTYEIFRGPFQSLQDYYAAVLDVAFLDVLDLTQAFETGSFRFEPNLGKPKFQGTFLDQGCFYYLTDYEDRTDADWKTEQRNELEILSGGIKQLRAALPNICAKAPETSSTLTTILGHNDLSRNNIFVDDAGTPTGLLDWEALQMKPAMFLTDPPVFIQTYREDYEPEYNPIENEKRYEKYGFSEKEKEESRKSSAEVYAERLEEYSCTKLRSAYQEELSSIGCPLAKAVWKDYHWLDRQLQKRVLDTSANVSDLVEWTEAMLAMGEESDGEDRSEVDDEDEDENEDLDMSDALIEGVNTGTMPAKDASTETEILNKSMDEQVAIIEKVGFDP